MLISDSYGQRLYEQAIGEEVKATLHSLEGRNASKLIEQCEKLPADCLVIGYQGQGMKDGKTMGSVRRRALFHAEKSAILILKKPWPEIKSIAVGIDGSLGSYSALDTAIKLSKRFGWPLHLAAVCDPFFHSHVFHRISGSLPEVAKARFDIEAQKKLHDEIIGSGLERAYQTGLELGKRMCDESEAKCDTALMSGRVAQAIATQTPSDHLLVLGRVGLHDDGAFSLGSNAGLLAEFHLGNVPIVPIVPIVPTDPSLALPDEKQSELTWENDAEAVMKMIPGFVRERVRKSTEIAARNQGIRSINAAFIHTRRKGKDGRR